MLNLQFILHIPLGVCCGCWEEQFSLSVLTNDSPKLTCTGHLLGICQKFLREMTAKYWKFNIFVYDICHLSVPVNHTSEWLSDNQVGYCICVEPPFNSLAPGKFEWNFRYVFFKWILMVDGWGISSEIALILMSMDFTDDQSTLLQVMAWCRQATSHYLSQCWPRSLSPYGVTRPQWVK